MIEYYKRLIEQVQNMAIDSEEKKRLRQMYETSLKNEELKEKVRKSYKDTTYDEKVNALFADCPLFEKLVIELLIEIRASLEKKSIKDILGIKGGLFK